MFCKVSRKILKKLIHKYLNRNRSPLTEQKKNFGKKYPEETIYIVRRPSKTVGLLSYVITTLGHIQKAVDNGYKIVVDMKNYENMYQQSKKENSWEYFFEQPSGITLKDAYKSRNVILSSDTIPTNRPSDDIEFFYNFNTRRHWQKMCKKYLRVNFAIAEYVNEIKKELGLENEEEKKLGILCRGTDYTSLKPQNHPVQPSASQVIEKIKKLKGQYRVDKIFLVTEDKNILEKFIQEFSADELKFLNTKRFSVTEKEYLVKEMDKEKTDKKQQGIDYLAQILLLAQCNYFIAGRTSGSVGVALFTEGFEYEYYWDLGRY